MATVINTPAHEHDGSGVGLIVGVVIALVIIGLFVVYVLPAIRSARQPRNDGTNINIELPNIRNPQPAPTPAPGGG